MFRIRFVFFYLLFFIPFVVSSATESRPQDLLRVDDVVEISAPVSGDLYAAGMDVVLRGPVGGDVLAAGRSVVVQGAVSGDVRIVGDRVRIENGVGGNVSIIARSLTFAPGFSVGQNVVFYGQSVVLANTVRGDVRLSMVAPFDARIAKSATIDGRMTIASPVAPTVEEGAILRYSIAREDPSMRTTTPFDFLFRRIIAFFSLFLVGLVVIQLAPRPSLVIVSLMHGKPLQQILWGFITAVAVPLLSVLLAFTIIGFPLALIIGALSLAMMYSARIFTALAIAFFFLSRLDTQRRIQSLVVVLLLGMLVLIVLESLPSIGFFVRIIATVWALGAIVTLIRTLATQQQKI